MDLGTVAAAAGVVDQAVDLEEEVTEEVVEEVVVAEEADTKGLEKHSAVHPPSVSATDDPPYKLLHNP